nr:MAG TPA: hypothetical protein [Caudoviricetes sp.]
MSFGLSVIRVLISLFVQQAERKASSARSRSCFKYSFLYFQIRLQIDDRTVVQVQFIIRQVNSIIRCQFDGIIVNATHQHFQIICRKLNADFLIIFVLFKCFQSIHQTIDFINIHIAVADGINICFQRRMEYCKNFRFVVLPLVISPDTETYHSCYNCRNADLFLVLLNELQCLCTKSLRLFCCFQIDWLQVFYNLAFVWSHCITNNATNSAIQAGRQSCCDIVWNIKCILCYCHKITSVSCSITELVNFASLSVIRRLDSGQCFKKVFPDGLWVSVKPIANQPQSIYR